jgi:hypothetical protein
MLLKSQDPGPWQESKFWKSHNPCLITRQAWNSYAGAVQIGLGMSFRSEAQDNEPDARQSLSGEAYRAPIEVGVSGPHHTGRILRRGRGAHRLLLRPLSSPALG